MLCDPFMPEMPRRGPPYPRVRGKPIPSHRRRGYAAIPVIGSWGECAGMAAGRSALQSPAKATPCSSLPARAPRSFVGTAGNAQTDLFGELISGRDTDSSTIYRYTAAGGLRPWIGGKASQHMMVFDV